MTQALTEAPELAGLPVSVLLALEGLPDGSDVTVYAAGSLVEGFGNTWSDLDLFVIGDRDPIGPYAKRAATNQTSQHYVDGRRVDFEFWRPADVTALARRVAALELGSGRHIEGTLFLFIELAFIHRLRTGRPLLDEARFAAFQALFDVERFRAFQTEETIRYLDALLEDLVGMNESGQLEVGLLRAREALDAAMDAYLHRLGSTDPTRKWRPLHLARLDDGSDRHRRYVDAYWRLQYPDAAALRRDPAACRAYLEACARFANEVVTWIQA